jgi:hypothetical protein
MLKWSQDSSRLMNRLGLARSICGLVLSSGMASSA